MTYQKGILATTLILNILSPLYCFSQGWEWQNPLPQGDRLGEVQFVDSLHGWIRTGGGTILRTTDGGDSWNVEVIGRGPQNIYFVDKLHGWAIGSGAPPFILRTKDGGITWENLPIPAERNTNEFYYNFRGLHFLDTLNGYITDDFAGIFHTKDGGLSWEKQSANLRPKREIRSIFFVDSLKGFAIGQTPLLYTKDGGRNWSRDSTVIGGIDILSRKIFFTDTLHGWILTGNEKLYRTANGGRKWEQYIIDSMTIGLKLFSQFGEFSAKDLIFLNPQQGWLTTNRGLYSSTDSGQTWQQINSEYGYEGVYFVNTNHGWITGERNIKFGAINNQIFETLDGGKTLQSKTKSVTNATLWGVDFIDEKTGWAVGDGTILHTTDGGETWVHQTSPSASWLRKVIFLNRSEGWIVGFGGTILHTKDGGQKWEKQESGTTYDLEEASFVSSQKGWVVGWSLNTTPVSGIVLHTSNGGALWQNQTPAGIGRLFGVAFIDSLRGWIATGGGSLLDDGGKLYRTLDGGESWEIQVEKPNDSFGRIVFVDSLNGWVAALNGILYTTNGGNIWEIKSKAMSVGLFNVQFVDPFNGWAVGAELHILMTVAKNGYRSKAKPV